MATTYDANIPSASKTLMTLKETKRSRILVLRCKGLLDRRNGVIRETEDGRCESQFSRRYLRKLDGDIDVQRRQLHLDTYEGVRRLAELDRDVQNAQEKIDELEGRCRQLESQASGAPREGDAGAPPSVVAKRIERRRKKASAGARGELASLRQRRDEALIEMAEIEEVHRQRVQIARDCVNQLCSIFLIEMHIYLDAAKKPGLEPPCIEDELAAEMAIA